MPSAELVELTFLRPHIHRGIEYREGDKDRFYRHDAKLLVDNGAAKPAKTIAIDLPSAKPPAEPK